jgi:rhodanese-related sulfurtransferase
VREATSVRVAHILREHGFETFVVKGGLSAWRRAGYESEPVPHDDRLVLPKFA